MAYSNSRVIAQKYEYVHSTDNSISDTFRYLPILGNHIFNLCISYTQNPFNALNILPILTVYKGNVIFADYTHNWIEYGKYNSD